MLQIKRVLVIDDSSTIRAMIAQVFERADDINLVGMAASGDEALLAIDRLRPDVLTLDIAMPGMDGLTLLDRVMRDNPIPVIVLSSLSAPGSEICERALTLGAWACIDKAKLLSEPKALIAAIADARRGKRTHPAALPN